MPTIIVDQKGDAKGNLEVALAKFKSKCRYEGLYEVWQKTYYEKPSVIRHRKHQKNKKRGRKMCSQLNRP